MFHIMELVCHEGYGDCHGDSDGNGGCMEMSFGIMHWCAYTALPALATQGKSRIGDLKESHHGFDLKMLVLQRH